MHVGIYVLARVCFEVKLGCRDSHVFVGNGRSFEEATRRARSVCPIRLFKTGGNVHYGPAAFDCVVCNERAVQEPNDASRHFDDGIVCGIFRGTRRHIAIDVFAVACNEWRHA